MKSISAADANWHFSSLLREVARGVRIVVTSRGKPVATISAPDDEPRADRLAAKRALLARLRRAAATGTRDWSRTELYE